MNKCFIALRRDILFKFLAKQRRFALANLEAFHFWNTSVSSIGLYYMDFSSSDYAYRIGPTDLTHGFVHGLKEIVADEGRMAESFDE